MSRQVYNYETSEQDSNTAQPPASGSGTYSPPNHDHYHYEPSIRVAPVEWRQYSNSWVPPTNVPVGWLNPATQPITPLGYTVPRSPVWYPNHSPSPQSPVSTSPLTPTSPPPNQVVVPAAPNSTPTQISVTCRWATCAHTLKADNVADLRNEVNYHLECVPGIPTAADPHTWSCEWQGCRRKPRCSPGCIHVDWHPSHSTSPRKHVRDTHFVKQFN